MSKTKPIYEFINQTKPIYEFINQTKPIYEFINQTKPIYEFINKDHIKSDVHYTAVDLGLSVKWCSCNVGAKSPEDYGLLFQWGLPKGYKYGDEKYKFLPPKKNIERKIQMKI